MTIWKYIAIKKQNSNWNFLSKKKEEKKGKKKKKEFNQITLLWLKNYVISNI